MPTYDYKCEACGHAFEKFQSITAPATRKCPKCGRLKVRRQIGTGGGVIFRGSGFYQTDYRSDSYNKAAEKDKPPDKGDKSKSDKGGDKSKGDKGDDKSGDKGGDKPGGGDSSS